MEASAVGKDQGPHTNTMSLHHQEGQQQARGDGLQLHDHPADLRHRSGALASSGSSANPASSVAPPSDITSTPQLDPSNSSFPSSSQAQPRFCPNPTLTPETLNSGLEPFAAELQSSSGDHQAENLAGPKRESRELPKQAGGYLSSFKQASRSQKSIRPFIHAIMAFEKGRKFSTGTSAHRKRQMSTLVEKEGHFGPALTVRLKLIMALPHKTLSSCLFSIAFLTSSYTQDALPRYLCRLL